MTAIKRCGWLLWPWITMSSHRKTHPMNSWWCHSTFAQCVFANSSRDYSFYVCRGAGKCDSMQSKLPWRYLVNSLITAKRVPAGKKSCPMGFVCDGNFAMLFSYVSGQQWGIGLRQCRHRCRHCCCYRCRHRRPPRQFRRYFLWSSSGRSCAAAQHSGLQRGAVAAAEAIVDTCLFRDLLVNVRYMWFNSNVWSAESEVICGNPRIQKNEASQEPEKKRNAQPRTNHPNM